MKQISFPKHRRQKINFEKLSGEQVCKSAIAIHFNLLQVGPSDASLFFDLLPYFFLLFMLWEAISKFYSVCWWYPRDRQVFGWVIRRELLQRVSEWWVGAARSWIFEMLPALRYWIFQILSARFKIFLILPARSMNISNFAGKILNFPNLAVS